MKRLLVLCIVGLAPLQLTMGLNAQPVLGTGCPAALPVVGAEMAMAPGIYHYNCPPPVPPLPAGPCTMVVGLPTAPFPLGGLCAPGPCPLGCSPIVTVPVPPAGFFITVPAAAAGLVLCFQCACGGAPCSWLSMQLTTAF
jgi:hypothetical protein